MQKVSYMGNGSTTEFNFNFPYFENSNVVVTKNGATATGYSVVGTSAGLDADIPYTGGKVVFDTAPSALDNITISRSLPLSRIADYQSTVKIDPTTLNQDLNYFIELLKDRKDEMEELSTQYSEIADKESTTTLLAQISAIHDEIVTVSGQISALGDVSTIRSDITSLGTNKLNKTLDNIADAAKIISVSWGRLFTNVGTVIAMGGSTIAGTYSLGFTDNKVKIGVFECCLLTTQSGFSNIAIKTDVMTTAANVCGTNNLFRADGTITVPFINSITVSFPASSAGIGSGSTVKFIGYM